jgi:hypothetical protein
MELQLPDRGRAGGSLAAAINNPLIFYGPGPIIAYAFFTD